MIARHSSLPIWPNILSHTKSQRLLLGQHIQRLPTQQELLKKTNSSKKKRKKTYQSAFLWNKVTQTWGQHADMAAQRWFYNMESLKGLLGHARRGSRNHQHLFYCIRREEEVQTVLESNIYSNTNYISQERGNK